MKQQRMIAATSLCLLTFALGGFSCLAGCRTKSNQRELTLSDFDFLERDIALDEVINRLRLPDRFVGSGIISYQWDLADGRIVELSTFGGHLHGKVQRTDGTWERLCISDEPDECARLSVATDRNA